jgi:hypothetical protein
MMAVTLATGVTQEAHEWYAPPAEYAKGLVEHPGALRLLFGLDVAFLVLYTGFFVVLADLLRKLGRPFALLALGFMLATAVLDVLEDHHILTMLDMAVRGQLPSDAQIAGQQVPSSTKFTVSYIALFLFGLAMPRDRKLGIALMLFLTVGTLITAVINNASSIDMREQNAVSRWVGFLVGFGLIGAWLRTGTVSTKSAAPPVE